MIQYRLCGLKRETDGCKATMRANVDGSLTSIPFCPDNVDYRRFKKDLDAGVELLDAEGNLMTQEQVTEFLNTLP